MPLKTATSRPRFHVEAHLVALQPAGLELQPARGLPAQLEIPLHALDACSGKVYGSLGGASPQPIVKAKRVGHIALPAG
jgi:hypothetical protein